MRSKTDNSAKQRSRVRMQQNIVSFCCFLCVVFAVGWIIHSAGNKTDFFSSDQSSSRTSSDSSSSKPADSSSAADSSAKPADSSQPGESSSQGDVTTPDVPSDAHPYTVAKDINDELDDALFIGDSRTVGLFNNCYRPKATFYCSIGLNIQTCFESQTIRLDNGNMGIVIDALAQGKQFGRVYIGFGTNEMGWPYYDSFIEYYAKLVENVRKYSPNAKIYCESILPVTASRELQGDAINNNNVKELNGYIQNFAASNGCTYLNCDSAVAGEDGKLPEEASTDGIHLNIDYCKYWLNYIIDET
ncbi:MAG: SGNH/GDSL hydrolase family protein [Ruminococcus sp.]|nr:SGNH/GDSL hydrolase family protein [Ruminococcus sp.]